MNDTFLTVRYLLMEAQTCIKMATLGDPKPVENLINLLAFHNGVALGEAAKHKKDAQRWEFVETHKNYQGSSNGYRTFKQAVDAGLELAAGRKGLDIDGDACTPAEIRAKARKDLFGENPPPEVS